MTTTQGTDPLTALLARAALGDEAAFARLYELASPKLFALALRILRQREWAEETLQEGFINIWRHIGDYHPGKGAPMTWMAAIVRNRALDVLRRVPREPQAGGSEEFDFEILPDHAPGPLADASHSQDAKALRTCLDRLQPLHQQCMMLAYYRAFTHDEIAQHLGQPLGSVKTWIRRGLERLKECLQK